MSVECPLCKRERKTVWLYEDEICWVARCSTHRDKWLIVLKAHKVTPSIDEAIHLTQVKEKLFGTEKKFRKANSILTHFHIHEE